MSVRKTRNVASFQSIASEHVQRATTRVYNEAALNPSLIVSPYIYAWLEEHSRVHMYDPVGMLQYILSLASFLGEDNYIYRNNRQMTPTTLFLSLCTRPAYGKSDLFHATKDSIINLLCVRQDLGAYARSNKRKRKANVQMPDLNAFADELTRLGLLTALEKAPRLLLLDELDQLFVRNGLIPLANAAQNENNNFYEIALQLYSDNCLFSKHTSSAETTFQSNRVCIMVREIEAYDSWLCARLGKSREHVLRVAACIQLLELSFYLLEKYRVQYDGFGCGLADDQFYQQMLNIVSEFLKRQPMIKHEDRLKSDPVAIEVHNDVVRGAINYVQIIIRQYHLLFIDLDGTTNLNNINPVRKQQVITIPNTKSTNLCPIVQINNQSNIDTYQSTDDNQFLYSPIPNNISNQNHPIFTKRGITFAKHFLTYNSWILTNKCITSTMRHNTTLKNEVLQYLINNEFLCEIKGGLKNRNVRESAIDIWIKCIPSSNDDFDTIREWNSALLTFGITWKQYALTLSNINITDDLYMTDVLNEFIVENYSAISMFISNDELYKLVSPDVNNVAIEDAISLSASKTTSEFNNHMDEQEECMENIQLNGQDDEDEKENSSGDEDTMDSHHQQQQLLVRSSCVSNSSVNNNIPRQTSHLSIHTQLKTHNKKAHQSMVLNVPPKTTTFMTGPRFPMNNTSFYSNQQMQQQPIRATNTRKITGFGSNNSHHSINSTEPTPTAFELMSTRLLQSERNRKTVGKNNSTSKKK
ncbi:unnamed protein product [Rotaria sordida]|uniref:Uncharacterized protein n=1 Tax=Rotaria sordida TaxID=392033 RepID=A0A815D7T1_9BILA|nr:unnamed protein product [Rotaria sordida]